MKKNTFLLLLLLSPAGLRAAPEHTGFRVEIMNRNLVNLYGFGTYTHTKAIDAEVLFYLNPRSFDIFYLDENRDYMAHFATFAIKLRPFGWFPVLRDLHIQPFAGAGSFPFVIKGLLCHATLGVEFIQSRHFAMDINLKWIYAKEDGLFQWLPKGALLCLGARF